MCILKKNAYPFVWPQIKSWHKIKCSLSSILVVLLHEEMMNLKILFDTLCTNMFWGTLEP